MSLSIIALGKMNTDIFIFGVPNFPQSGEVVAGKTIKICAGGKSRNAAEMMGTLLGPGQVAMVSKTIRDRWNFWKIPIESLEKAGVNIRGVKILDPGAESYSPLAIIAVDEEGNNQIYSVAPPLCETTPEDVDESVPLLKEAAVHGGFLTLCLEARLDTALYAIRLANKLGLKVILDAGGIHRHKEGSRLLDEEIFLLKPNEHEARTLSGIEVKDFRTACEAARKIRKNSVQNLFITAGKNGGYLFTADHEEEIPIPKIDRVGPRDETGCGDQTLAALCVMLKKGKPLVEAARIAITAATLEFHKPGIDPVTPDELAPFLN